MKGTMLYGARDVRFEERPDPTIIEPTDAIIKLSATCVCGSDLWPYRGIDPVKQPMPMGHEYVGIVEEVGSEVRHIKPGQFVVGSFFASDNTCEICRSGYQTSCVQRQPGAPTGAQAQYARIPLADGTLVATPDLPPDDLLPSLLSASDVFGTGWFAADAAAVGPGKTVAVVGDGAVGLRGDARGQTDGRRAHHRDEPPPGSAEARAGIRRDRHRHRTRRRRRGEDQGSHQRARRALDHRGGRHPGVDDAVHPLHAPGRACRVRRCAP